MIGVQDEDAVQRAHQHVVHLVFLGRHREHHAHEIGGIGQVVARIDERLAHVVLVGHRHDGRQLGDQPEGRDLAVLRVVDVERVVIEGRQRAHHAHHHRHRMRIAPETLVQARQLLVHHRVMGHHADEIGLLLRVRQFAVQQQVAHLEEIAVLRQLLDRVAAVQQHALVAVDVGDRRAAARRGQEARVVGEHAGLAVQRADVDHVRPDRARQHRKLDRLAVAVVEDGLFRWNSSQSPLVTWWVLDLVSPGHRTVSGRSMFHLDHFVQAPGRRTRCGR